MLCAARTHEPKKTTNFKITCINVCLRIRNSVMQSMYFNARIISPCVLWRVSRYPYQAGCDFHGPVQPGIPAELPSDDCAPPPLSDSTGGKESVFVHPEKRYYSHETSKISIHTFPLILDTVNCLNYYVSSINEKKIVDLFICFWSVRNATWI